MAKYEIHISDVRSFKACRRKWNWASPLRRNLEPNVPYAPFFTGRAIHHCLEHYHRSGIPMEQSLALFMAEETKAMQSRGELWPQEQAMVSDQLELIVGLLKHYELWAKTNEAGIWSDNNLEFLALETPFSVPIRPEGRRASNKVYLAGRMDGVVRRKDDGTYWIWETKTTRSIDELKRSLGNDNQAGTYIYAAQTLFDVSVSGVLYNMLRKKVPTKPEVLKSGLLSKRKEMDTTAQAYLAAIREHHPGWKNDTISEYYGDMLQLLLDKGNTFFARYPVRRSKNEITQLVKDLHTVSLEMTNQNTPIYPNESWLNCNFCQFKAPCLAYNAGSDVEFLLSQEFRVRIPYQVYEGEEEGFNGNGNGRS
jgi:hypothetical protein